MSTTWTTKRRSLALQAFEGDIDLDYGVVGFWKHLSVVESAVHEIAHAVCLDLDKATDFDIAVISGPVRDILGDMGDAEKKIKGGPWHRSTWQEMLTLAVEELVLRKLNLRIWRSVIIAAAIRDGDGIYGSFVGFVERSKKTKIAKRRARRVMRILDEICERGCRAKAVQQLPVAP